MGSPTVLDTPCRVYQGRRHVRGYGLLGRRYLHRWVWEQVNGPIPPGLVVMHRCDNPPCFRLDHLALGTQADNLADMRTKGRGNERGGRKSHCPRGHAYPDARHICLVCRNEAQRRRRAGRR